MTTDKATAAKASPPSITKARKFHIIINEHAGTVLSLGQDKIRNALETHLSNQIRTLSFLQGDAITAKAEELATQDPHAFLIGGGDGTILNIASIAGRYNLPFGIIPLGTMNLMAQDLNMSVDMVAALQSLHTTTETKIDASFVNGKPFLCSAVIGIVPESAIKREEARLSHSFAAWSEFLKTLSRGLSGQDSHKLRLRQHDKIFDVDVSALVISNNKFVDHPDAAMRYRRASLIDGKLAIYGICSHGALDAARLAFKLWNGKWLDDDTVFHFETESLQVESADGQILISLDGEPCELPSLLHFTMTPASRSVIMPVTTDL